jgi:DNA-binding PadR family transcriptional regulator
VSQSNDKTEQNDIAYDVLSYLAENTKAEDTLGGIAEWWLLQQRIRFEMSRIRNALDDLIARGLVVEVEGPDKSTYYRMNEAKREEIKLILERRSRGEK